MLKKRALVFVPTMNKLYFNSHIGFWTPGFGSLQVVKDVRYISIMSWG